MEIQKVKELLEEGFSNLTRGTHLAYGTLGELFLTLQKGKAYKKLGYANMDEIFKDLGKPRTLCYQMMQYREYLNQAIYDHPELANIPAPVLVKAIPAIQNSDVQVSCDVIGKLREIAALPETKAMKDEIKRLYGNKTFIDCEHNDTTPMKRCNDCHAILKVGL